MAKRSKSYNGARPIKIDLSRVRIGGNYAALRRANNQDKSNTNPELEPAHIAPERREYVEKWKYWMQEPRWCAGYSWLLLHENYELYEKEEGLTRDEYYEIAKVAINTGPNQMNRLRKDKVSDVRYFELCKIMASHGIFDNVSVDFEKLNNGTPNGTYKIANFVIDSFYKAEHECQIQNAACGLRRGAKYQDYMSERDAAQLLFYMWLIVHNGLFTRVSDKDITEFVDKGLVTPMDADRYIVKLTQNAAKSPCTGLIKSVRLGQGLQVPEFCKKAQDKVLNIYDALVEEKSNMFDFTR